MNVSNSRAGVAALILAGGRGERLGGTIKSELEIGGKRLLERVAAALEGCAPLLVAHGRIDPASLRLLAGMIAVPDLDGDYAGPLAGMGGAVAYLNTLPTPPDYLVSVAVDTPFVPPEFVDWLRSALLDGPCAIAAYADQPFPTNAIWRPALLRELPEQIRAGTAPRSLKSLSAELGGHLAEWPVSPAGDPFANINTPTELAEMRHRARLLEQGPP